MTGLLEPVFKEVYQGRAEVRETFRIPKVGTVAGCYGASTASITRDSEVRLLRDNVVVHTGKIGSLRRFKDDASEVEDRHGVRHLARQLQRHQAGRRDRGVRHRAGRHRSVRLDAHVPAIGVTDPGIAAGRLAFAQRQAARGEEPEGPAARTSSTWRWPRSTIRISGSAPWSPR